MKSIMVTDTEHCVICSNNVVEEHHCWHGTANRAKAEKYHLVVPLCNRHHTGADGVHTHNRSLDKALMAWAQSVWESKFGDRNDFIREFGKNVL